MNRTEVDLTDRLLRTGRITAAEMERCLEKKQAGAGLIDTLVQQNAVTTRDLEMILAEMPRVTPASGEPDILSTIPKLERYIVLGVLGRGGIGSVYLAYDTKLKRSVALKAMRVAAAEDLARFRREVEIAASLRHPNIAAVFDTETVGDVFILAMQYVDGEPLDRLKLSIRDALTTVVQAATALQVAHGRGIIHRDLKPSNLMRTQDGHLFLMDFGTARPIEGKGLLTQTGGIVGTPTYMSPEQARGATLDARTDVYSLGATLYSLATNRSPFPGSALLETLRRVEVEEPARPRAINPLLHRDIETIILKAMNKNPRQRYQTVAEFAADIERFLAGEPILARPQSFPARCVRYLRKRPWAMAVASAILVAVLAGSAVFLLQVRREMLFVRAMTMAGEAAAKIDLWDLQLYLPPQDMLPYRKHLEEALVWCDQADRQAARGLAEIHYQRARALLRLGETQLARQAIDRAVELEPSKRCILERIRIRLRIIEIAMSDTSHFLNEGWGKAWPGLPSTFDAELTALLDEDCQKAIELSSKVPGETSLVTAMSLCFKRRLDEAAKVALEALPQASPADRVLLRKVLAVSSYLRLGDPATAWDPTTFDFARMAPVDDAIRHLSEAIAIQESDPELYVWRALLNLARGSYPMLFILHRLPWAELPRDTVAGPEFKARWTAASDQIRPHLKDMEAVFVETAKRMQEDIRKSLLIRADNPAPHLLNGFSVMFDVPYSRILAGGDAWVATGDPGKAKLLLAGIGVTTRKFIETALVPAEESCRRATRIDPKFAAAWILHARLNAMHLAYGAVLGPKELEALHVETMEACSRVLELQPTPQIASEVSITQARIFIARKYRKGAEEAIRRVAVVNPMVALQLERELGP